VCPVPGCPSPQLTTRGPESRRHHFLHLQAPADPAHQRAYIRRVATELIAEWVTSAHPRSVVETDVVVEDLTIAVRVTGPTGEQFAVMFVDHRLGVDAWWDAEYALNRAGFLRGWVFAPGQFLRYPQPSPDAGSDDPAAVDRLRGDIVLDRALFREMRREGRWPLLLNINRREVANLIVPRGQVARRLGLRSPASGDRVLHLVTSPLDECRLCRDGIQTPAVGAEVLALPRLAREQQEIRLATVQRPTPVRREEAASSATPSTRNVRDALESGGPVTTLATLVTELGLDRHAEESRLREQLYNLRIERVIDFDRPLGRFSAIRVRRASS
jgi:hypothetical protein